LSAFFEPVQQVPVVSQVKLIAEPWDIGEGGYQVGNFPPLWTEWNGQYRDTVRDFWRGEPGALPDFASRLTGSSDLYADDGRRPLASINFVTCHDGFTLNDLVSYDGKHNDANGEGGRDGPEGFTRTGRASDDGKHNEANGEGGRAGPDDKRSWNCGHEGPTDDLDVIALRERQKRNFLTTLSLSQGVPMLLHGDEIGRTRDGNNNAYCQDNELSWVDWTGLRDGQFFGERGPLLDFVRRLSALRTGHPVFRRRRFFLGDRRSRRARRAARARTEEAGPEELPDLVWFTPDGTDMGD